MKSRLTLGIIGCTLLTVITPNILQAQARDFGTNRQPRTCASTSAPKSGRISAAQAMKYVACQAEGDREVKMSGTINFIDILNLEVAPKSRQVNIRDIENYPDIDTEKLIYNLRGSVVAYTCYGLNGPIYQRGQNCTVSRVPKSTGKCSQNTFGDWRCSMSTYSPKSESKMPPPN
jgi:hypothetical protein